MHGKLIVFFWLLILSAVHPLFSQNSFDVIGSFGDCRYASSRQLVKIPSQVKNTDSFYFKNLDTRLYLHREGELYRAKLDHLSSRKIPLYLVMEPLAEEFLSIHRGDQNRSLVYDFRDFFKDSTYAVAGDTLALRVHDISYPIGESSFFVIRFEYNDQVVNRRVGTREDILLFSRELFYDKNHQPIPREKMPKVGLYYVQNYIPGDRSHMRPELLYNCRIIFLEPEDVLPVYQNIRMALYEHDALSWDRINNLVCRYVWDLFGYTAPDLMSDWLQGLDP